MPIMQTVIQGGGTTPTGTKSITANGVYDVTDFASADVQVPTTAPAYYVEKTVVNRTLQSGSKIINLNGVTDVGNYVLMGDYYGASFPANTSVDLSSLTTVSGISACQYMFVNCTGLTSVDLSGLTTVSGMSACQYMFQSCTWLKSVDLSSLTTISGSNACSGMFQSCSSLTNANLSGLTTISGSNACLNMFSGCSGLTSIDLSGLTTISGSNPCASMLNNCVMLTTAKFNALNTMSAQIAPSYAQMFGSSIKLESVEFGGLTASTFASAVNQIQYLFSSNTGSQAANGCTVHFPSNFDPSDPNHTFDITTLSGYPTFGGSASYIYLAFDLPATE